MVHAKNAVLQELVASTLKGYKIPVVPWRIYKAAKEMADMERDWAQDIQGYDGSDCGGKSRVSGDRRSIGRR
jgi:hypothetical protein